MKMLEARYENLVKLDLFTMNVAESRRNAFEVA